MAASAASGVNSFNGGGSAMASVATWQQNHGNVFSISKVKISMA